MKSSYLGAIILVVFISIQSACQDDHTKNSASSANNPISQQAVLSLPTRIEPRKLSSRCSENLGATVKVDQTITKELLRNGSKYQWLLKLTGMTLGEHSFTVEFYCNTNAYGRVILATSQKLLRLDVGNNYLTFESNEYSYPDTDSDGFSNLDEIERGMNPFPTTALPSALQSVTPADKAIGIVPSAKIYLTFSPEVEVDQQSLKSAFTLYEKQAPVPLSMVFDTRSNTAAFTPVKKFNLLTAYRAVLSNQLTSTNGSRLLDHDFTWEFVTKVGTWKSPLLIFENTPEGMSSGSYYGSVALDADEDGNITALWSGGSTVQIGSLMTKSISNEFKVSDPDSSILLSSEQGRVYLNLELKKVSGSTNTVAKWESFYRNNSKLCLTELSASGWSPEDCIDTTGEIEQADLSNLVIDRNNAGVLIFQNRLWAGQTKGIYLREHPASLNTNISSGWSGAEKIEAAYDFEQCAPNAFSYQNASKISFIESISHTDNIITIAWLQGSPIQEDLNTSTSNVCVVQRINGSWSHVKRIGGDGLNVALADEPTIRAYRYNYRVRMASDASGNLLAVWNDAKTISFNRFSVTTNEWGTPHTAYIGKQPEIRGLQLVMDKQGNAIVVWEESNQIKAMRYRAFFETWSQPILLSDATHIAGNPETGISSTGYAHVIWKESTADSDEERIATIQYNPLLDKWQRLDQMSEPPDYRSKALLASPKIKVNDNGSAFAIWSRQGEKYNIRVFVNRLN